MFFALFVLLILNISFVGVLLATTTANEMPSVKFMNLDTSN